VSGTGAYSMRWIVGVTWMRDMSVGKKCRIIKMDFRLAGLSVGSACVSAGTACVADVVVQRARQSALIQGTHNLSTDRTW